ncbi:MAG: OmpA family protein [Ignavibacteria bacterium]|nr:OmpA family protein [Ignavibacteria bacterium]
MKSIIVHLLLVLSFSIISFAQSGREGNGNYLSSTFLLTIDGGATYYSGDFSDTKFGFLSRAGFEYFFGTNSSSVFGLKLLGSYGQLGGKSTTGLLIGDAPARFSKEFNTKFMDGKFGLIYALDLGGFIPYLWGGGNSVVWFQPKDANGSKVYAKQRDIIMSYFGELGFKIILADGLSLNFASSYNASGTDELDGYVSKKKDIYLGGTVGISIIFGSAKDSDNDGVNDDYDLCPNTPSGAMVDEFGCPIKSPKDDDGDGIVNEYDKCPNTPIAVKVDNDGCPVDSDRDGVPDYKDKCPNTPSGFMVNELGCPLDSDSDGVPDNNDACPNTPSNVQVNDKGCPLDSDQDGVPDYLDKCPNTEINVKVDSEGCKLVEEPKEIILQGMTTFETGKSTLTDHAKKELYDIAQIMLKNPLIKWRIEGHTDSQGSTKFNQKLSEERAVSVMNFLIGLGVGKDRLSAAGMGESFPIADNATEIGRQKNRRVVITRIN